MIGIVAGMGLTESPENRYHPLRVQLSSGNPVSTSFCSRGKTCRHKHNEPLHQNLIALRSRQHGAALSSQPQRQRLA
jgi:hypothetical protein